MILKRLLDYSYRVREIPPPRYQPRFITKRIVLDRDGHLVNVVPLSGEKRGKKEGLTLLTPQETPQRTSAVEPRLVCDNASYVLGKAGENQSAGRVAQCHDAYRRLLEECAGKTGDDSVKAIVKWLECGGADALRDDPRISPGDEIDFEVEGIRPTEQPAVQTFWTEKVECSAQGLCLVTGQHSRLVDRMPVPIKGVPQSQPSGAALVSVNNPSGESYGLSATLNSPISFEAAERACNALNHLLASELNRLRIGAVVFVYWTREEREFDLWNLLDKPDADQVRELIDSPARGVPPAQISAADFYVLALGANKSRVVVRDYQETTLDAVKRAVANWFDGLSIVGRDGSSAKPVGLFSLAASLYPDARDIEPQVVTELTRTAIVGAPLPSHILALAVRRNAAMQGPFDEANGTRYLSEARVALIKYILQQEGETNLTELNLHHPDAAYHCGRLLAVLERIQRAALGNVNATIVDRYYGAACTSPAVVLGHLVNKAQAHLAKLRKDNKDRYCELALEGVLTAIGTEFPRTLNLYRQGLFALGFYHQKAFDHAAAAGRAAKEGETQ